MAPVFKSLFHERSAMWLSVFVNNLSGVLYPSHLRGRVLRRLRSWQVVTYLYQFVSNVAMRQITFISLCFRSHYKQTSVSASWVRWRLSFQNGSCAGWLSPANPRAEEAVLKFLPSSCWRSTYCANCSICRTRRPNIASTAARRWTNLLELTLVHKHARSKRRPTNFFIW